jgi:MFS family permease
MVGAADAFIPLFALALGHTGVFSGLLSTVPMVTAACLQLVTPAIVRRVGFFKPVVVASAAIQAFAFVPLIVGAIAGSLPAWVLIAAASLYSFGGVAGGPAWTSWIGLLVPRRVRAHFFASRARWLNAGVLVGLLGCGYLLRGLELIGDGWAVRGFAFVFAIAAIARGASATFLALQGEARPPLIRNRPVSLASFLHRLVHGPDGRLVAYIVGAQFAAQIAQPFFVPYMKNQLRLSPDHLALLVTCQFAGRIVAMPMLGRLAQAHGEKRVLCVAWAGLAPIPIYWLVSDNFAWLLASQIAAGVALGAFELATQLMLIGHIGESDRTSVMSWYNLLNSLAFAGGSALGAMLLAGHGEAQAGYTWVFVASLLARLATAGLLTRVKTDPAPSRYDEHRT